MEQERLPAGGRLEQAENGTCGRAAGGLELDDYEVSLRSGLKELEIDSERDDPVVTLEPLGRGHGGLRRRCEERIDPGS